MAKQKSKLCVSCNQVFRSTGRAQTCSERCRKRLYRAKKLLAQETSLIREIASETLQAVEKEIFPKTATEEGFIQVEEPATLTPSNPISAPTLTPVKTVPSTEVQVSLPVPTTTPVNNQPVPPAAPLVITPIQPAPSQLAYGASTTPALKAMDVKPSPPPQAQQAIAQGNTQATPQFDWNRYEAPKTQVRKYTNEGETLELT